MVCIVLIEDLLIDCVVFIQWLCCVGYEVLEVDNVEDGLQLVCDQVLQLVLMDVVLFGMSGFQVICVMVCDVVIKYILVIIVSIKVMEIDKVWGLCQGVVDYIVKLLCEDELIVWINELVV